MALSDGEESTKEVFPVQTGKRKRMSEADFPHVAFTFSALPMFKTVSAIILSHQKKLIDPPASPIVFALERIYLFI